MTDARGFGLDISKWIKETVPARVAEVQRTIVAEALTLIVQATPVGNHTKWKANILRRRRAGREGRAAGSGEPLPRGYVGGHARKNWQVTIGASSSRPLSGVDANGSEALRIGYDVAASIKSPTIAYIGNPLPYMFRLENGWSKQAPRGMVAQAVAAISAKYARVQ